MSEVLDEKESKKIASLCAYGEKLFAAKRYEEAIVKYKDALEFIPSPRINWNESTWIYVAIGDVRFVQGLFDQSFNCFLKAVECPDGLGNPFIHLRLGQCALELSDKERAADELARAYMIEGEKIFKEDDGKYLEFIAPILKVAE
jgi:tetratricopeptide (TPR) repeat protein